MSFILIYADTFHGYVFDISSSLPIEGATVIVGNYQLPPLGTIYTGQTDNNGYYEVTGIPPENNYTILIIEMEYNSECAYFQEPPDSIDFYLYKPDSGYLVHTINEGLRHYEFNDTYCYRMDGSIEDEHQDLIFPDLDAENDTIDAFYDVINLATDSTDVDSLIWQKLSILWDWLGDNAFFYPWDSLWIEASNFMTQNGEAWPSITRIAQTYFIYGVIPWGTCFSKSQTLSILLSGCGIPVERIAIEGLRATFVFSHHYIVCIYMADRWLYLEPASVHSPLPEFENFSSIPSDYGNYDVSHPYEFLPLPGSEISQVPETIKRAPLYREIFISAPPTNTHTMESTINIHGFSLDSSISEVLINGNTYPVVDGLFQVTVDLTNGLNHIFAEVNTRESFRDSIAVYKYDNYTVDGFAYLPDQIDHSGIQVTFYRTDPFPLSRNAYTDSNGYYSVNVYSGIYEVTYSKENYFDYMFVDVNIFADTTLAEVTLFEPTTLLIVPTMFNTIQLAIDQATDNDTVLVEPGTYFENITISKKNIIVGSNYFMTQDTTFISQTIINGDSDDYVVKFSDSVDSTTVFTGFTVTNGSNSGLFFSSADNPIVSNIIVKQNTAYRGGGINISSSDPILSNIKIYDNHSTREGGGLYLSYSNPKLENIEICNNQSDFRGGGISCLYSSAIFDTILLENNFSVSSGVGLYTYDSDLFLKNCVIKNNISQSCILYLSGIVCFENLIMVNNNSGNSTLWGCQGSDITVKNAIISNNMAPTAMYFFYCGDSNIDIINADIYENISNSTLFNVLGSEFSIKNSIISNNQSTTNLIANWSGGSSSLMNNNFYNNSCGTDMFYDCSDSLCINTGININGDSCDVFYNIQLDPLYDNPSAGNYYLTENSPCINAGTIDTSGINLPDYDLYGNPRIIDGIVDMGAYEYQGSLLSEPADITVTHDGLNLTITWEEVTGATSYTLYSCTNPYAIFPNQWTIIESGIESTSAVLPLSGNRIFYRVTANN